MDDSVIARAVSIVRTFDARHQVLGVSEVARRTNLPKATAHRMLRELAVHRVLERSGSGYRLGLLLFEVGALVPVHHTIAATARPV